MKRMYDLAVARNITRKAARVIALTPGEIPEREAVGVPRGRIAIINNGIPLAAWQVDKEKGLRFRARLGIPADAPLVFF